MMGSDNGGSKDLWNAGKLLPDYTALQPRKQPSSYSPPWEPQILHNMFCFYVGAMFISHIEGFEKRVLSRILWP
jgi:hypothetical protein